jgi:hypothetical protein
VPTRNCSPTCVLQERTAGPARLSLFFWGRPDAVHRLVEEVFSAGRELVDRPSLYGSTHFFTGDIEIKDV